MRDPVAEQMLKMAADLTAMAAERLNELAEYGEAVLHDANAEYEGAACVAQWDPETLTGLVVTETG